MLYVVPRHRRCRESETGFRKENVTGVTQMRLTQSTTDLDPGIDQQPIELFWRTSWDFFSGGSGSKSGYITDLRESGCTLKTVEPIEFRRWIRLLIGDPRSNISFTAVGRVVRCENSFEASVGSEVTLYRYRVEFTYPVPVTRPNELVEVDAPARLTQQPMVSSA